MNNVFPRFWTRKNGTDFEAEATYHRRLGLIRKCGYCGRGVIAHGDSLLRKYCLICGGDVRKAKL